jgi:hypothetical protein
MVKNSLVCHRFRWISDEADGQIYGNVQEGSALLVRNIEVMCPVLGEYLPD